MNWWTASIGVVCAADIFVGPGETYTTIQSAVAIANASDTIIVRNGIYTENINVAVDNVTIRSENGSANCVVRRASNDHIFEVTADYVTISGFKVGFAGASKAGICLNTADHCTISENNVWNNNYGIFLWASNNNNLTGNTASENFDSGIGIFLDDSNNNNLTGNTASENFDSGIGIFLDDSNNNNLTGNTAYSNTDYGIFLDASSSNTLTDNTANSNTDYGIYLYDSSNNNTLTGNTASNTGVGGVGIYLLDSINNRIYNNYFSNTQNAWDTGNTGNNVWNTSMAEGPNIIGGPSLGGNYWSDYTGEDLDHDCLGDTPYNVPIVSFDYLPLLLPYTHTDVGVTVTIELSEPGEIEPLLPPDTDLSNALVINVNVIDDTPGNQTNPAYTDNDIPK